MKKRTAWSDPFLSSRYGTVCGATSAAERLSCVKDFGIVQLRAALEVPGLQSTVRTAIERRLRKLDKAESLS